MHAHHLLHHLHHYHILLLHCYHYYHHHHCQLSPPPPPSLPLLATTQSHAPGRGHHVPHGHHDHRPAPHNHDAHPVAEHHSTLPPPQAADRSDAIMANTAWASEFSEAPVLSTANGEGAAVEWPAVRQWHDEGSPLPDWEDPFGGNEIATEGSWRDDINAVDKAVGQMPRSFSHELLTFCWTTLLWVACPTSLHVMLTLIFVRSYCVGICNCTRTGKVSKNSR